MLVKEESLTCEGELIEVELLVPSDLIKVKNGEVIPVDGLIKQG